VIVVAAVEVVRHGFCAFSISLLLSNQAGDLASLICSDVHDRSLHIGSDYGLVSSDRHLLNPFSLIHP